MKYSIILLITLFIGGALGAYLSGFNTHEATHSETDTKPEEILYWVAPMDKHYRRDEPGLSPMGMELVPVYADEMSVDSSDEDNVVLISPSVENNLGVKTISPTRSRLYQPIKTVGTIQFDEGNIQHIHSRVEGWIEVLNIASVGDRVKKGQVLYELYSPALVNAQEEYLAAIRSANKNLINASISRLVSLGLSMAQVERIKKRRKVDQRVNVLADSDGVVLALLARPGMFIKPASEVLSIGQLDTVWVIGEVFERQSYLVERGQKVSIQFNALPDKTYNGVIDYIYPELDEKTRTQKFRVSLDNVKEQLKPNMLANINIAAYAEVSTLNIPSQAVIKASNHARVVKSLGGGKYQSVLVNIGFEGREENGKQRMVQVLNGLSEEDDVVVSAQFLIDSESNVDAELNRMHNDIDHVHPNHQMMMEMSK